MLMELLRQAMKHLPWRKAADTPIDRVNKHKQFRWYIFSPREGRSKRILSQGVMLALAGVLVFSAGNLLGYGLEYLSSALGSGALRETYHAEKAQEQLHSPTPTHLPETTPTPHPSEAPSLTEAPAPAEPTGIPAPTATPKLTPKPYPGNPYAIKSGRFTKLLKQNKDIIGWITLKDVVDEPVVQRDNQYYLDRDYMGYHNKNGAIFLDEAIQLRTRPYTLMLYGHNMKSGRMFGNLRNYENATYYRNNPFITFDTLYEDGRYVIFAVCTVSTNPQSNHYMNWAHLRSSSVPNRQTAIDRLFQFSVYGKYVDVRPDDQILLLVTCVDDASDRRVIAARRLRDDETEEGLLPIIQQTRKK